MSDLFYEETFRPAFGRWRARRQVVCALAGLSVLGSGVDAVWQVCPGWPWWASARALYWRPLVEVSAGGVRAVNVFRTFDVPWP
ncbi:MAG: hypothetical protein R2697_05285 [Ilumatobacteraceae bacterium]